MILRIALAPKGLLKVSMGSFGFFRFPLLSLPGIVGLNGIQSCFY